MNGPVEFLEAAHKQAEEAAEKAAALCGCHPPRPAWSFRDGDEPTDGRILIVDDPHPELKRTVSRRWNGSYRGLFMAEHIVRHDPEAVLRRIGAERRLLAECQQTLAVDGWEYTDTPELAERVIRGLAEGWGWTEVGQRHEGAAAD
ncbi:DUF6221 family protein [Streptomyces sp. NPDC093272]|uniref:DUF6221 family protein n=1 Tax=Streptomyces sp. NPDC093272 TaxID=3154981 RepID=UPI0034199E3C